MGNSTNAFSISSIEEAENELNRIEGALQGYYDTDQSAFRNMRQDFDMDGTSDAMEVNHKLLSDARAVAQSAITETRAAFREQSAIASNTMDAALRIVSGLTGS